MNIYILHYYLMSHERNRWPQKTLDSKPSYPSTVGYLPRWGCDNNTHRCSSIFQGCAMFGVATRRLQICSTIDLWDATISEKQHIFEGWRLLSEQGNATFFFVVVVPTLSELSQMFWWCLCVRPSSSQWRTSAKMQYPESLSISKAGVSSPSIVPSLVPAFDVWCLMVWSHCFPEIFVLDSKQRDSRFAGSQFPRFVS